MIDSVLYCGLDDEMNSSPEPCIDPACMPAVKKGQIVRVDKDKYLNSINVRQLFNFIICLSQLLYTNR